MRALLHVGRQTRLYFVTFVVAGAASPGGTFQTQAEAEEYLRAQGYRPGSLTPLDREEEQLSHLVSVWTDRPMTALQRENAELARTRAAKESK